MKTITANALGPDILWPLFINAIDAGHALPPAQIEDTFLGPQGQTLLSRAAWIQGLGFGVKSVTVMAGNAGIGLPTVQGAMLVFDETRGTLRAVIESDLVTNLKTAADSALGARYLARPDSRKMLVIGAGKVAANVIAAYSQTFSELREFMIWNRTGSKAKALATELSAKGLNATAVDNLEAAVVEADIITTATMSTEPVLKGAWVQPGTHVDLIGAFRAEMREADDALLQKARLFVDSRDTTVHHIGEIKIPLAAGIITETDILADLYQLKAGALGRTSPADITVFKNGGGAHLDLMTACAILETCSVSSDQQFP
ncbi:ornithine cyclodeaminase [uncultured Sulfitobacter sp.]|uniref:ornithine cyclodeaminase family protein n=1 Tax=uncultured Sulfitobacter sp. TaxID=191468 RepID=UPI0026220025|nr:ornithine cyclodeaminase [uncultured Sulfitobacter sp.]